MAPNQPDPPLDNTKTQSMPDDVSSIQSRRDETQPPPAAAEDALADDSPVRFGPPVNEGEVGTFGRYRVLKLLGQGGMGAVYLAFDQRLSRKVALKVMLPKAAKNAQARDRFVREARAAAQISDDHVVAIHEADEYKGTPFIALQYLEGSPLDQFLKKKGNVSVDQAIRIGMETALGLEAAHKLGLVHRDIKPANLWLEAPKGRVKILDFGLARQANEDAHLTQSGAVIGTPAYMSPEQARGEKVDNRTDLFSLGTVLYRLTTGAMPFKGNSAMAVLTALAVDDPIPVRQLNPKVSEPLAELIHQLLSKSAEDRPKSAAEVAERLESIQKGGVSNDKPTVSKVEYVPLAVSVITEDVWAGIDDHDSTSVSPPQAKKKSTVTPALSSPKSKPKNAQKKPLGMMIGLALAGMLVVGGAVGIVIKITNKDGSVTELKVPDDAKVEVNGKNVTPDKPKDQSKLDPLPPWTPPPAVAIGESPFDKLDPNAIPKEERFDWQPRELVGVIGTHARRQWDFCNALSFSPDGKLAITHHTNIAHDIAVWDVNTGNLLQTITTNYPRAHESGTFILTDGKRLILAGQGYGYQFFDKEGNLLAEAPLIGPDGKPIFIGTSKFLCEEGKTVIVLSFDRTQIWSFAIRENSLVFVDEMKHVPVPVLSNSPLIAKENQLYFEDNNKLFSCSVKNGKFSPKIELAVNLPAKGSVPIAVTPDGSRLVISKMDDLGGAEVWDITGNIPKLVHKVGFGHNFNISPDRKWLVAKNGLAYLYRLDKAEPAEPILLDSTEGGYGEIQFSPNGSRLVLGNNNGLVRFWDLNGAEPKELSPLDPAKVYMPSNWVSCPQIDPRSSRLMLQPIEPPKMGHQRYQLWDWAATPRQLPSIESPLDAKAGRIFPIRLNRWIQVPAIHGDRPIRYEIRDNRWQAFGELFGEPDTSGTVSPDGKWMIQFSGFRPGEMKLHGWDVSGEPALKWSIPCTTKIQRGNQSATVTSSDNGSVFAVFNNELLLYRNIGFKPDLTDTIPIKNQPGQYRLAISPDGRSLAHLPEKHDIIEIADISNGKARPLATANKADGSLGYINWLAYSPDGKFIAYASNFKIGVLSAKTLKPIYEWKTPGPVHWVGWAPDGRHLVTLNGNRTAYVLRLNDLAQVADRKAAEFVLSIGGQIGVDGKKPDIKATIELPKEPFLLTYVILQSNQRITDSTMEIFKGCKNIQTIYLNATGISDAGLVHLKDSKQISQLVLDQNLNITDVGLAVFKDCLELSNINLTNTQVSDAGLALFKNRKNILTLNLCGTKITDEGLEHLRESKDLAAFNVADTKVTDVGLAHLKEHRKLVILQIVNTKISDAGLVHVKDCQNMSSLDLELCPAITDASVELISRFEKLTTLSVKGTKLTSSGVEKIRKALPKCKITWDGGTIEPKP